MFLESLFVSRLARFARAIGFDQVIRTRQAAGLARQNMVAARSHDPMHSVCSANFPAGGFDCKPRLAPQLAACHRRALSERFELCPGASGMDAAAESAIGGGDDPLAADAFGETNDALSDQLRMFDDIGGVTDRSGQNDLALRQLDVLPHRPLMLVANVAGFEGVGLALHGEHDLDNIAHWNIGGVRPVPASPAQVKADAV